MKLFKFFHKKSPPLSYFLVLFLIFNLIDLAVAFFFCNCSPIQLCPVAIPCSCPTCCQPSPCRCCNSCVTQQTSCCRSCTSSVGFINSQPPPQQQRIAYVWPGQIPPQPQNRYVVMPYVLAPLTSTPTSSLSTTAITTDFDEIENETTATIIKTTTQTRKESRPVTQTTSENEDLEVTNESQNTTTITTEKTPKIKQSNV